MSALALEMQVVQDTPEREEAQAMPDRRESGFRDPRFWVGLGSLLVVLVTGFWAIAQNSSKDQERVARALETIAAMSGKIDGIDNKLNALTLDNNSKAKDIEFVKKELSDLRNEWKADKDLQDTWIAGTREKIIKLEAQQR